MEFVALPSVYNSPSNEIIFGSSSCWEGSLSSRIGHACQLDIDQVAEFPRATSIVCSLGPSWCSEDGIKTMISNGMNMLRLNLNTHSREMCLQAVKTVRKLEELSNYTHCISIVMDVTVESIRTGFFQGGPKSVVVFNEGDKVQLTMDESIRNDCTKERIFIDTLNFPQMIHSVYKGDRIFLGDGLVCMIVKEIGMDYINCLVEEGGPVTGYQRVILPRERLYHRSVEATYLKDLAFAAECKVDFVFTSYADNAQMILDAKSRLPTGTKVFANIETKTSVRNLPELIEHADGIVVSRAALGLEFPPEKIFKLQKYIIAHCNVTRRPVFVIAQLLESMYNKPRPTRAEASDVANAVLDGVDGLILTSETSKGIYPHDAVKFMHQICREAERAMFHKTIRSELNAYRACRGLCKRNISHVTALSAVEAAENSNAKGIFVITTTGESAISVACAGPCCPVIAITRHPEVARHCHAYRGLFPYVYTGERLSSWSADVDLRLNAAVKFARSEGIVKPQDTVIIVTGTIAGTGRTNTMQIFKVPGEKNRLEVVSSKSKLVYPDVNLESLRLANGHGDLRGPTGIDLPRCPL